MKNHKKHTKRNTSSRISEGETSSEKTSQYESYDYHLPVMLQECIDYLITDRNGVYLDGTLGGGGHSSAIIEQLGTEGRLYSFDADTTAIEHCQQRFAEELAKGNQSRIILCHDNFENFHRACSIKDREARQMPIGLLLDLGVSSRQLDSDSIGLSYRVNSRLNMRFGSHGRSAEDLLAQAEEDELLRILRLYGEEPRAGLIARRLSARRRAVPLKTTFDLRDVVAQCVPQHLLRQTLSRVFQAFRIAVNDELGVLERTLRSFIPVLRTGGRIVIMSYHSLEDRIVKNIFREFSEVHSVDPVTGQPLSTPELKILTKKPREASPDELLRNPRARSAKLRVAEKQ